MAGPFECPYCFLVHTLLIEQFSLEKVGFVVVRKHIDALIDLLMGSVTWAMQRWALSRWFSHSAKYMYAFLL